MTRDGRSCPVRGIAFAVAVVDCTALDGDQASDVYSVWESVSNPDQHCQDIADSLKWYIDNGKIYTFPDSQWPSHDGWHNPTRREIGLREGLFNVSWFAEIVLHEGDHANHHTHNPAFIGWPTHHPVATFNSYDTVCPDA